MISRPSRLLIFSLLLLSPASSACGQSPPPPAVALGPWIEQIIRQQQIDALSIAVVDGDRVVWAAGFGQENPHTKIPCTADSIYRVGSVSKLFTDIALMQLVEQGKLDLDAPLDKALPDFKTEPGWEKKVTLRQIMAHRAGIVREPPVGHYFDPTKPSLIATIDSLKPTALIHEPGSKLKYSNAGIALIGRVIEVARGKSFEESIKETVLRPLGMDEATFDKSPERIPHQVVAKMWALDGRSFDAPTFPMGIGPAGDLRASVNDLAKFAICLMNGGKTKTGQLLSSSKIDEMWTPKFDRNGARADVGVGFFISKLDGKRRVGHGGAVYGCATELMILPDDHLAVAVATSKDCANGQAGRVAEAALRSWLAARAGQPLPLLPKTQSVGAELARAAEGSYGDATGVELQADGSRLYSWPRAGGTRAELRRLGTRFIQDDEQSVGTPFQLSGASLKIGTREPLARTTRPKPEPSPEKWAGLLGEYGWDHNILTILEKDGKLHALIEWFFLYPLKEVGKDQYLFPDFGLYSDETVVFHRDAQGRATDVVAAGVKFSRRKIDGEGGVTFRIKPLQPIETLRTSAKTATPPAETGQFRASELVDLTTLDPTIKLDIRYASDNNFLGTPVYTSSRAFLQRPAAEALLRAHWAVAKEGYGLLIHDGYRPWSVTKVFHDATPDESKMFVADPAKGSRHNRGCAVDLSLYDLKTGKPVAMVGGYDEFSARAYPDYVGGTSLERWHRSLLRKVMEAEGFTVINNEWWHFDYKDWKSYRIGNQTFEELSQEKVR